MGLRLITPPTTLSVALADVKKDLRVDHTDDDAMITEYIKAGTQWVEQRLELKLMPQTWDFVFDLFPTNEIKLPFGPLRSVVNIFYIDADGLEQTVPSVSYYMDDVSPDPWIFPIDPWPTTLDAINAVRVQFIAGYEDAAHIPTPLTQAVRLMVRQAYDGDDVKNAVDNLILNFTRLTA